MRLTDKGRALTEHGRLVAKVMADYGATEKGFHRAITEALAKTTGLDTDEVDECMRETRIPDAFRIHPDRQHLDLFEVEVHTNRSKETMLDRWHNLWFYLDCEEWTTSVTVIGRWGGPTILGPMDFVAGFYERICKRSEVPAEGRLGFREWCQATRFYLEPHGGEVSLP